MVTAFFADGHGRLEDKNNSFTLMRISFALIILSGHAIQIPHGLPFADGFPRFLDFIVQRCLDGFFILSGYMITASALQKQAPLNYALARAFRILPGLFVCVMALWLVVGPLFSEYGVAGYWSRDETWRFPLLVLSQADPMATLPGAFGVSPSGDYANGPLWTIRYEILAYIGVGLLMTAGLYRTGAQILLWSAITIAGGVAFAVFGYSGPGDDTIATLSRFGPAFMIGGAIYVLRGKIRFSPALIAVSALAAMASSGTVLGPVALQLATASFIIWLGYRPASGPLGQRLRNLPDISYGIYILHWPIGMMVFSLNPALSALALWAVMLPLALLAGWLMRKWVEDPALAMKSTIQARPARLQSASAE